MIGKTVACMCMLTDGGQYRILEHHIFHIPVAKVFHVLACFLDMQVLKIICYL